MSGLLSIPDAVARLLADMAHVRPEGRAARLDAAVLIHGAALRAALLALPPAERECLGVDDAAMSLDPSDHGEGREPHPADRGACPMPGEGPCCDACERAYSEPDGPESEE